MATKQALYCLIYRVRRSNNDVMIDTRRRTLYYGFGDHDRVANDKKIKRLITDFAFGVQAEIR